MKRLTESDKEWFMEYLKRLIKEEEFNAYRYQTQGQYERVAKLKKIYNILKYEHESHSDDPLYGKD